ncbi:PstA family ABC transporter permease [Halorussus halobius]|uniref:PstA family ABC transporter permease n=1 Tax=Halorussus halobius TaxID=1710537 RepID=UPI00109205CF|nr:ABC transporter permease subunit [Halorussus halobius]
MDRYTEQRVFGVLARASAAVVVGVLALLVGVTLVRGGGALLSNPSIVVTPPGSRYMLDGSGGFLHAVLGSVLVVVPATAVATVLALSTAVFLQRDYSSERVAEYVNLFLDVLWGTPPIVYGVFVLTAMIAAGARASLFAGVLSIAIFEYPIITRYADEALRSAPEAVTEATYGLGATRFETARMTVRAALPGVVAGVIMGFARGVGDAATVLFTAGGNTEMPGGLFEPATTLPILIFQQATSFNADVRSHAYAASFVLIVAVLASILASKYLAGRFARYAPGGNQP